jgi:hypothetical protein
MGVRKAVKKAVAAVKTFSPSEVKKHTVAIQAAVAKHRGERKYEHFQEIDPEDIVKKLQRVNSPMITSQGWGSVAAGGTMTYSVGIFNPDPVPFSSLYVHVFFGSGNPVAGAGEFLLNVDQRLPRVTEPAAFGFTLAATPSSTSILVPVKVPAGLDKGKYIGNAALLQFSPFNDVGKLLDRAVFVMTVT